MPDPPERRPTPDAVAQPSRRGQGEPLLSVVVPCYNEAEGIEGSVRRILELVEGATGGDFELVLVDDHSRDATPEILHRLAQEEPRLKVLRLGANRGSHVASRAGLEHCRGTAALFLTADLQEGPELLAPVLEAWRQGADLVCSIPELRDRGSRLADLYALAYYGLLRHSGRLRHVGDVRSSARLLDRKTIDYYCRHAPRHHNMSVWLLQQGFQMAFVPYRPRRREFGNSKWSLKKRFKLAADTLLDVTPLLLTGWLGLGALLALLGAGTIGTAAVGLVPGDRGTGLLAGLLLAVGGPVLLAAGCLGTYLWRLHDGLRHGPEFTVQWALNLGAEGRGRSSAPSRDRAGAAPGPGAVPERR